MPPGEGETIHQAVDTFDGVMLGLVRQMGVPQGDFLRGVAGGGENGVMAEDLLHLDQIDACFDQMGCIAVPQAVWRNLFFRPQASTTLCRVVCTPPRSSGVVTLRAPFKPA